MADYIPTYGSIGGGVASGSAPTWEYPVGVTAGMILVGILVHRYSAATVSVPSDWTLLGSLGGGAGVNADDSGEVVLSVYYKRALGTETGSVSITLTGGNIAIGRMMSFSDANYPRMAWNINAYFKAFNTGGTTAWSITTNENVRLRDNDMVIVAKGINTDTPTFSAYTYTATGATFGARSQRSSTSTTGGNDARINLITGSVASGVVNTPFTYNDTASASTANGPTGVTAVIVLRSRRRRT
jgi:MSHA biogenesis protein MshQ